MTDRKLIQALIEQAYEARRKSAILKVLSLSSIQTEYFQLSGSQTTTAVVGITKGHDDIRTTLTALVKSFEFLHRDLVEILIDGDAAAVHSRTTLRFVPKDKTVTTDILDLWKL